MTEKPSPLKLRANQENATRSTGPRTNEGKRRSAFNGARHGRFANEIVLEGGPRPESPADFQELIEDLEAAMKPQDGIEHALVQRVAVALWRLRRAHRFEAGAVRIRRAIEPSAAQRPSPLVALDAEIERLRERLIPAGRLLARLVENDFDNCPIHELGNVLVSLEEASALCDPPRPDTKHPAVLDKACEIAQVRLNNIKARLDQLCRERKEVEKGLNESPPDLSTTEAAADLPAERELMQVIRYESMLDRQLHRALAEFRRRRDQAKRPHLQDPNRIGSHPATNPSPTSRTPPSRDSELDERHRAHNAEESTPTG